jgi:hypothetical protein
MSSPSLTGYLLAFSVLGFALTIEALTLSYLVDVRASSCGQVSAEKRDFLLNFSIAAVAIIGVSILAIFGAIYYGLQPRIVAK